MDKPAPKKPPKGKPSIRHERPPEGKRRRRDEAKFLHEVFEDDKEL